MSNYRRFTNLKQQYPDVKFLLGFGGWTDSQDFRASYKTMLGSSDYRASFRRYVTDKMYSGL